jgi:hypothetical protein
MHLLLREHRSLRNKATPLNQAPYRPMVCGMNPLSIVWDLLVAFNPIVSFAPSLAEVPEFPTRSA